MKMTIKSQIFWGMGIQLKCLFQNINKHKQLLAKNILKKNKMSIEGTRPIRCRHFKHNKMCFGCKNI